MTYEPKIEGDDITVDLDGRSVTLTWDEKSNNATEYDVYLRESNGVFIGGPDATEATTEIYTTYDTLSLHDALPIYRRARWPPRLRPARRTTRRPTRGDRSEEHTSELQSP